MSGLQLSVPPSHGLSGSHAVNYLKLVAAFFQFRQTFSPTLRSMRSVQTPLMVEMWLCKSFPNGLFKINHVQNGQKGLRDDGGPPAAPTARIGWSSLSTMVGLMLESGRFPGDGIRLSAE